MCRRTPSIVPRPSPDGLVLFQFLTSSLRAGLNSLPKLPYLPKCTNGLHLSRNAPDLVVNSPWTVFFAVPTRYVAKDNAPSTVAVLSRLLHSALTSEEMSFRSGENCC